MIELPTWGPQLRSRHGFDAHLDYYALNDPPEWMQELGLWVNSVYVVTYADSREPLGWAYSLVDHSWIAMPANHKHAALGSTRERTCGRRWPPKGEEPSTDDLRIVALDR